HEPRASPQDRAAAVKADGVSVRAEHAPRVVACEPRRQEDGDMADRSQRAEGKVEEVKGRVKRETGEATGRKGTEARGAAEELKGKAKQKIGKARSEIKKASR